MTTEKRLLIAFAVSALLVVLWSRLFPPPEQAPQITPEQTAQEQLVDESEEEAEANNAGGVQAVEKTDAQESGEEAIAYEEIQGEREEEIVLENDVLRVQLTNKGAAITSLVLLRYEGDDNKEEPLDLIQSVDSEQRTLPMQLWTEEEGRDERLYRVEKTELGARFTWASTRGDRVEKELSIGESGYGIKVAVACQGEMKKAKLSIGTGMRNVGPVERESRLSAWGDIVINSGAKNLERIKRKKVKEEEVRAAELMLFVGFEDTYFLNILRAESRLQDVTIRPITYLEKVNVEEGKEVEQNDKSTKDKAKGKEEKPEEITVLQLLCGMTKGQLQGELLAAPKEYDLLQRIGGGVERTLDFGMFHAISVLFLKALWWIYERVHNYGFAIILLTVAIRIILFPLVHKSTVSMRKMAKLQPKMKEIQAKYKKSKTDPEMRAKMSQETMALYKQEGVNPVSGCLPMLVQLPILWALYQLFLNAIELRHAPFILWIDDLSAKDPILVTPILMAFTMWLQQKLAPQTGDPQQQKLFRLMPFIFGFMFLQFPSGLVLYWLTNNVIQIIQQEVTLRMIGERGKNGGGGGKGKSKR